MLHVKIAMIGVGCLVGWSVVGGVVGTPKLLRTSYSCQQLFKRTHPRANILRVFLTLRLLWFVEKMSLSLSSQIGIGDKLFRYGDFFSEKIIVGSQEAQYPQFLLQLPLTHYILRSIFFRTHSTPPICLKTQKCAILSTFSESGGKNHPKVGVRREKFNIGNCPKKNFMTSYICWELTTKFS